MTRGPRSTSHTDCALNFGCGKGEPLHAPVVRFLGAATEDREGDFLNQCSGIEAPCAWPDETTRSRDRGLVSRGTDMAVGVLEGRLTDSTSADERKQRANHQLGYWPHLQALILP
jgi:hypothetical protein